MIKVLFLNCSLKKLSVQSNTHALINKAEKLYKSLGAQTEIVRVSEYNILPGVTLDEGPGDDFPDILDKIKQADILIFGSPIWLGNRSSLVQSLMERLDGTFFDEINENNGQFLLYGKVAGILITGNEDGAQHVASQTLFNLSNLGCTIPPNCDSYWVGVAGPGPSYIEAGGEYHEYTNKTLRYMVHNTLFFAKLLSEHPITTNLNELSRQATEESR